MFISPSILCITPHVDQTPAFVILGDVAAFSGVTHSRALITCTIRPGVQEVAGNGQAPLLHIE
jgi:hypothetical protein